MSENYNEVYRPAHYQIFPDTEVIDLIQTVLTPEEYRGYCKGNILKYRLRAGKKDPTSNMKLAQDIEKADQYELMLHRADKGIEEDI